MLVIKYLEQIDPKEHALFLISGGGSSLLSLPPESIKFAEAAPKPALYRPKAVYVGKDCGPQGCEYKSLDLRT